MSKQILTDWNSRVTDVAFLQPTITTTGVATESELIFGSTVKASAGVQTVVQKFLSLLLTDAGSSFNQTIGSTFMRSIRNGQARTVSEVRNQFALAVSDVTQQISRGAEPDERFASASLSTVNIAQDRVELTIQVLTEAGTGVLFLVPLERR